MNFTPETVELIVQRVLEHLEAPGAGACDAGAPSKPATEGFRVSAAVVTQALLAESVNGVKTVRIGTKAIVTPSARDYLRQKGIEVIRESAAAPARTGRRVQIIVATAHPHVSAAVEALEQSGIGCEKRLSGLPAEAATQAISAVCRGEAEKVVIFTAEPELVACLANRNAQIRAAAVADAAAVRRMQTALKPNVLAIDPSPRGVHELKTLLKAF
jgi:hypothetical protein